MVVFQVWNYNGIDFSVDVLQKLMREKPHLFKKVTLTMKDLAPAIQNKTWDNDISIADVLKDPGLYPEHMGRVHMADYDYPIIVTKIGIGTKKFVIVDGNHRVLKNLINKKNTIDAVVVSHNLLAKTAMNMKKAVNLDKMYDNIINGDQTLLLK